MSTMCTDFGGQAASAARFLSAFGSWLPKARLGGLGGVITLKGHSFNGQPAEWLDCRGYLKDPTNPFGGAELSSPQERPNILGALRA